MNTKKSEMVIFGIVLVSFAVSVYFYSQMPERIASHWNVHGQVDGYLSKSRGLFLMPCILIGLTLLFAAVPRLDPHIEKFRKYYDGFIILFFVFMLSVHLQVILWNAGIRINPNMILPVGLGILFFYTGILCENTTRNRFIGIRTPWTLSSEKVWEKTHKVGGKLFRVAGVIALFGIFFSKYALFFILVPVIFTAVYAVIYSYREYQKETG
ncbi:MAG: SdpI family protein [bacterium]